MARRRYALQRGGPRELTLQWGWGMRNFVVECGGSRWKVDRPTLAAGVTLVLPDGSSLFVRRLRPRWFSVGEREALLVERDGVPVPGSDRDPRVIGRRTGGLLLVFGVLRGVFLLGEATLVTSRGVAIEPFVVVMAVSLAALLLFGVLVLVGRRLPAVLAAASLTLEALVVIAWGHFTNPLGLLIQVLVIVHLVRAYRRMAPRERKPTLAQVFE